MLSTSRLDLSEPPATWSKDDENESFPSHRNRRDNGCRYLRGACPRACERVPGRMGTRRSHYRPLRRSLITAWVSSRSAEVNESTCLENDGAVPAELSVQEPT
jgi:hypothetical protein